MKQLIGAIDIGGTKISVGILDESGKIIISDSIPTQGNSSPQLVLSQTSQTLEILMKECDMGISVIGIGCTGPVDPFSGIVKKVDLLSGWEGINLVNFFSEIFKIPVALENDADAAALGNWAWEYNQSPLSYLLVSIGTGIGAGMILNGCIYRGIGNSHPELGHHVIDPSGPPCYCGAFGCWESLASGSAMEQWYQHQKFNDETISARLICSNADKGELIAQEAVNRTAKYLGLGLANIISFFTPELIVLSGGLCQRFDLFKKEIFNTINSQCKLVPYSLTKIIPAKDPKNAGLLGAGRVGFEIIHPKGK